MKKLILLTLAFLTTASPLFAMENGTTDTNKSPFDHLPDEDLLKILSMLDTEDFYNTALVCRRFWGILSKDIINQNFTTQEKEQIKKYSIPFNKLQQRLSGLSETEKVRQFNLTLWLLFKCRLPFRNSSPYIKIIILSRFYTLASKLNIDLFIDVKKMTYGLCHSNSGLIGSHLSPKLSNII